MASGGITLPFAADTRAFLQGTKGMEGALEDVGGSLDDLSRESRDTETVVKRSFTDMTKAGDTAADKMERSFKDTFDEVPRAAKGAARKTESAVDDLGDGVRARGKGKFADVGADLGGELSANIGEGVASGSGDLAGTVLGTLGGILPALGPLAAVAGIGALVVSSIMGGMSEAAKAQAQKIKDLGGSMFDAMSDGILDASEKQDIVTKALGADDWGDALDKIKQQSSDTGISVKTLFEQYATGTGTVTSELDKVIDAHSHLVNISTSGVPVMVRRMDEVAEKASKVKDSLNDAAEGAELAGTRMATAAIATGKAADEAARYARNLALARRAAGVLPGQTQGRRISP